MQCNRIGIFLYVSYKTLTLPFPSFLLTTTSRETRLNFTDRCSLNFIKHAKDEHTNELSQTIFSFLFYYHFIISTHLTSLLFPFNVCIFIVRSTRQRLPNLRKIVLIFNPIFNNFI